MKCEILLLEPLAGRSHGAQMLTVPGLDRRIGQGLCGLAVGVILVGCTVGPTAPKGQMTIQSKGAEALTNEGDPLMNSGVDLRQVPVEFAKGYTKGISDQVKRSYWAQQQNQRSSQADSEGRIRYYNATIPEHEDSDGVIRVRREVVIPIVE